MVKQEKPISKPNTGGSSESGNIARPISPVIKLPRWLMFIPLFLIIFLLPKTATLGQMSYLYIFGNNGKQSGRQSGTVMNRNGTGRSMGFFAKVLNQFTAQAQAIFSFFNSNWNALTDAQRLTWLDYITYSSNRFAESKKVTGKSAYTQLNVNIANVQGTAITNAPKLGSPPYTALSSLSATASTGVINLGYVLNGDGATTLIWATKPLNAGVSKPSTSAFRMFAIGDTSAASPLVLTSSYSNRFGAITSKAGMRIFVRVVVVDATTGQTSIANQIDTVIAP